MATFLFRGEQQTEFECLGGPLDGQYISPSNPQLLLDIEGHESKGSYAMGFPKNPDVPCAYLWQEYVQPGEAEPLA